MLLARVTWQPTLTNTGNTDISNKTESKIQITLSVESFVDVVGALEDQVTEIVKGLAYTADQDQATSDLKKMVKLTDLLVDIGLHNKEVEVRK